MSATHGSCQGQLSFSDITQSAGTGGLTQGGHGISFADVVADGLPEFYVTNNFSSVTPVEDLFFTNLGGGDFIEEAASRGIDDVDGGSNGATWADLDNDGDYDLFNGTTWASGGSGTPDSDNIFENLGSGTFVDSTSPSVEGVEINTRGVLACDMDNDGDLDLFGIPGSQTPGTNEAFRNDGDLQFTAIAAGDFDTALMTQGMTDTDYDGDGDVDILAASRVGEFAILNNDGTGDFTLIDPDDVGISNDAGDGITTADVDNDGFVDLLLASDNLGKLYFNDGDGTFTFGQNLFGTDGYMAGFADLDYDLDLVFPGDGDVDFGFAVKGSENRLFRNDFDSGNWLQIKLISPDGQAGAFGAWTRIFPAGQAGGVLLGLRESKSAYGYLAQYDPVLHFGLAHHTAVDVVVTFLDGTEKMLVNVDANQVITVDGQE